MSSSSIMASTQPVRPSGPKQSIAVVPGSPTRPRTPGASTTTTSSSSSSAVKATPEADRKRQLIRSIQILQLATKEQHCSEDELVQALTVTTFTDGEYVYCQGQAERDVFFIEEGKVLITQRRAGTGAVRMGARRRSVQEAELEIQLTSFEEREYFGEMALLQNALRKSNAVASGGTACMVLSETHFQSLLAPLHQLMLYRHLLRWHSVLEKHRLFKEFAPAQRQYVINHCHLEVFQDNELICRQNELDDRYFILADGEANVIVDESVTGSSHALVSSRSAVIDGVQRVDSQSPLHVQSSTVAQKSLFQGFGEMGLLDKPRTAHVVARGSPVVCAVVRRKDYIAASQLVANAGDADAESLLATTLIEEWNLVLNARNLHLSNPHVAHYLITFIKKFKAAYNQKFVGKTMYLDLLRRLHQEPQLGDEFPLLAARVTWESPASSLSILRSESRRILSSPPAARTPADMSFVGRMIESALFVDKFEAPPAVDRHKLARHLGRVMEFLNIDKDVYLFRQGKIESKAFLILRGKINIVNEDVNSLQTVKHYEVIATLSAGDSFGELSLVTRLQRSASALAPCDTDLLVLDRERLHALTTALPGVDVRHEMVERAAFLSRLDFFKGSDFGQCIRVAHDMHEVVYEPRHLFLKEPAHLRTLYIVKSGEVAVFLRRVVPAASIPSIASANSAVLSPSPTRAGTSQPDVALSSSQTRTVLVRVATIGAHEFFGIAIAFANIVGAPGVPSTAAASVSTPSGLGRQGSGSTPLAQQPPVASSAELAATVYMCCTRVQVLELSERGWRRLAPQSLQLIRNSLLERNRWNHACVESQTKDPSYFHADKPWKVLARSDPVTGKFDEHQSTRLVRHLRDKKQSATSAYALFRPGGTTCRLPAPDRCTPSRGGGGTGGKQFDSGASMSSSFGSTTRQQLQLQLGDLKAEALSLRPAGLAMATSCLGGSLSTATARPRPLQSTLSSKRSPTRPPSPCSPTALCLPPARSQLPSSFDFVRVLAPLLPTAHHSHAEAVSPSRTVRSSPGRNESVEATDAMWKLQRRPSLH